MVLSDKHSDSGSALILTLLITALLATITVSFLSTSRVEMIAAKNFSRQNAASGLAELATQQAIGKIQQGFTVTGNATTIITTQPGAIRQFVFSGGNITSNTTQELFSVTNATTNGTVNINNLRNPTGNATITSNSSNNQWTITGNAAEQITVPLENVTSNGTVIGRIAYYVDDEGTKLNLNAATGDRTTLNVGSSRSLSLSPFANATLSNNFTQVVEGNSTSNSTSNIKNWAHFFRPEQLVAALMGNNSTTAPAAITGNLSKFSAAPVQVDPALIGTNSTSRDYHVKRTPWGTPRLFINDLPTDSANATASVNAIYNALSDTRLRDIYGATFADKYTDLGLKQIAANMLQMRDSNTNNATNSFNSTVQRIGASDSETVLLTANSTKRVPREYFGRAPYAYINEIGMMVGWGCHGSVCIQTVPFVSIVNPEQFAIPKSEVDKWQINAMIDSVTIDITYKNNSGGAPITETFGPRGYEYKDSWGHNDDEINANRNKRNASLGGASAIKEAGWTYQDGEFVAKSDGSNKISGWTAPWSKTLKPGEELQICLYNVPWSWGYRGIFLDLPQDIEILSISNIKVKFEYITLSSVSGNVSLLRDFVLGSDTGYIRGWLQPLTYWPMRFPMPGYPTKHPWNFPNGHYMYQNHMVPPDYSVKRIDGRISFSANMTTNATANATANMMQRSYMRSWSANGTQSWVSKSATVVGGLLQTASTNNSTTVNAEAYPSESQNNAIPGDPVNDQTSPFYDFPPPFASTLQFMSGNNSIFTSPQELGKVHTNVQHRKLRFTTQHPNEVATGSGGTGNQTFIPDWAMLDVISFGSNITTVPLPAPVNLNGRFHVPSGSSPKPAARTAGLEAALKALDSATLVGNSFNASITEPTNRTQYIGDSGNVSSTIAANIGNLTWSTGNYLTSGNATWGKGDHSNDPGSRRQAANFPVDLFVLPAEVTEIRAVSDAVPLDSYTSNSTYIKANEGRLSALFPGATTQSRFFTIYAFAQAGQLKDKNLPESTGNPFVVDSEVVTKTLVEVIGNTRNSTYTVKKLYSQPIHSE